MVTKVSKDYEVDNFPHVGIYYRVLVLESILAVVGREYSFRQTVLGIAATYQHECC